MTDTITNESTDRARASEIGAVGRFLKATELDTRMLGMVAALVLIWIVLHILSGGLFLTPRNLWKWCWSSSRGISTFPWAPSKECSAWSWA